MVVFLSSFSMLSTHHLLLAGQPSSRICSHATEKWNTVSDQIVERENTFLNSAVLKKKKSICNSYSVCTTKDMLIHLDTCSSHETSLQKKSFGEHLNWFWCCLLNKLPTNLTISHKWYQSIGLMFFNISAETEYTVKKVSSFSSPAGMTLN
jgi:hypothetical protein